MSIASEINRIKTNIANAYSEIDTKGGTLPVNQNSANLTEAIASIPEGTGEPEYTQLLYIENTGTQYINTLVKPDYTTRFEINARVKSGGEPNYPAILGAVEQTSTLLFRYIMMINHIAVTTPNIYFEYGSGNSNSRTGVSTTNILNDYLFEGSNIYVEGPTSTKSMGVGSMGSFSLNVPLNLFGIRDEDIEPHNKLSMIMQLFNCKLWKNNELVRDFIPVKDPNNVVCLYDKVSKEYFYNEGTGTFIAGPEL